ncbi:unnamed protein product, partial [Didymodactylos carnosus]
MTDKIMDKFREQPNQPKFVRPIIDDFSGKIKQIIQERLVENDLSHRLNYVSTSIALKHLLDKQKNKEVVFRQTDKSKVFHLDTPSNYARKSDDYMAKTDAYTEISEHPLKQMIDSTNKLLRDLLGQKRIPASVFEKLKPPQDCELPHLYYNPKDHKPGVPLRPIVAGIKSPITPISKYLDKTLRPIFEKYTQHYTLQNTYVFLNHLDRHPMTDDTILATFDITDLYTMIPQKESIMALCRFLAKCGKSKINNISIDTFAKLSRHVLDNAYFAYENRLFKQIKGGPMGFAITQILADVYMFEWEKDILAQQTAVKQL